MKAPDKSSIKRGDNSGKPVLPAEEPGRIVDRLISPALLLLLHQRNSHGYELLDRLESLALASDASVVYRHLRRMEQEGLVRSQWNTNGPGPARRTYKLTADGEDLLHAWMQTLKKEKVVFEQFLATYQQQITKKMTCEPCATGDPCCEPSASDAKWLHKTRQSVIPIRDKAQGTGKAGSCDGTCV